MIKYSKRKYYQLAKECEEAANKLLNMARRYREIGDQLLE
jgi:hypothetical protein